MYTLCKKEGTLHGIKSFKIFSCGLWSKLYVDVSFKLESDSIQTTIYEYTLNNQSKYDVRKLPTSQNGKYGASNFEFTQGGEYSLSNHLQPIMSFLEETSNEKKDIISVNNNNTVTKYTITYPGIADFKRKTFKCSKVEYDEFGRIKKLQFKQIKGSSYGG